MTKPVAGRERGIMAFGTPAPKEIVSLNGVEGVVLRRTLDGSAIWVQFEGESEARMFSHRSNLVQYVGHPRVPSAFREFPEKTSDPALTIGRGGW